MIHSNKGMRKHNRLLTLGYDNDIEFHKSLKHIVAQTNGNDAQLTAGPALLSLLPFF